VPGSMVKVSTATTAKSTFCTLAATSCNSRLVRVTLAAWVGPAKVAHFVTPTQPKNQVTAATGATLTFAGTAGTATQTRAVMEMVKEPVPIVISELQSRRCVMLRAC
jgi:hypothetical protein